jgi:protein-tyrosine phosphatase
MRNPTTSLWSGTARLLAATVALCLAADSGEAQTPYRGDAEAAPYTQLDFLNDPSDFQFAVIGDGSGGGRPGVLVGAVDVLNLLRPEFVLGVGDLIEGYTEDEELLRSQWDEVDTELARLEMPFFFVPGNHDLNIGPSEEVWFDRAGAPRSYSHFVYKDVLFLLLSTEDPPKLPTEELEAMYAEVKTGQLSPAESMKAIEELEAWAGSVSMSQAQVDYVREVLEENTDVRWTFAFMHSPAWAQPDPGRFAEVEAMLADRPYTVFAGHTHTYDYSWHNGRDYVTMGMTGGLPPAHGATGNMDHVAWVTMTDEGPRIGNVLLNGVMDKRGAVPAQQDFLLFRPREISQPGRSLGFRSIPNLRDLGGYQTADGAIVRSGLVYRANQPYHVSPGDMTKLSQLQLKSAYDLRTLGERATRPGELPPTVNYVWLDVLADAPESGPAMLEELMSNPEEANRVLGGGQAEEGFQASYREFVSLPSARLEFRKLFLSLGDPTQLPALFHCTTGKDRTGWAAAALLTLLGVPHETVVADYLRSNENIIPLYQDVIDQFVAAGGDESIPLAILGVREEYLEAAFDEMRTRYGTIEAYFAEGLGIDATQQQAIRALFLAEVPSPTQ